MIVIDEASKASMRIEDHIWRTVDEISIKPIVVVCGDHAQQQQGHSLNVPSMLQYVPISIKPILVM